ncbi:MAG: hypothetical protein QF402_19145 [Candidatus Latescibacteria bacterium]|nr:hypothetical protein [Candidatus Latescibacterota bacterium]
MDKAPQMAIVTLGILAVTIPATAQDTVPVDYFVDVLLDEPFPTTIESGRPILLRGTDGTRTRHYAMVKYVNSEMLALAPTLLRLESTGVYHTQPLPPWTRSVTESPLVESVEGGMGLVGEFVAEDGDTYLMVVNRDFIEDATLRLSLRNTPTAVFEVSKQTGAEMVANEYSPDTRVLTLDLAGGDGRLFRLE